jgi:hypothetical protein
MDTACGEGTLCYQIFVSLHGATILRGSRAAAQPGQATQNDGLSYGAANRLAVRVCGEGALCY